MSLHLMLMKRAVITKRIVSLLLNYSNNKIVFKPSFGVKKESSGNRQLIKESLFVTPTNIHPTAIVVTHLNLKIKPKIGNGYIYILSNPSMPNVFKVGFTTNSINHRVLDSLHTY